MNTEIASRLESFILTFGLTIARANSDWSEAKALLNTGKDSKRAVGKEMFGSKRTVPHDIDTSTKEGKAQKANYASAAAALNAADVIMTDSMQEELEVLRLALKKADKPAADKAPVGK